MVEQPTPASSSLPHRMKSRYLLCFTFLASLFVRSCASAFYPQGHLVNPFIARQCAQCAAWVVRPAQLRAVDFLDGPFLVLRIK
jgi:hypothetical protein